MTDDLRVLDLGCGSGLLGLWALVHGSAKQVTFLDYNEEVIRGLTMLNCRLNGVLRDKVRFFAGSWHELQASTRVEYDVILSSETLYDRSNYSTLFELALRAKLALFASKRLYFGCGDSGTEDFHAFIRDSDPGLLGTKDVGLVACEHGSHGGVKRDIVVIKDKR